MSTVGRTQWWWGFYTVEVISLMTCLVEADTFCWAGGPEGMTDKRLVVASMSGEQWQARNPTQAGDACSVIYSGAVATRLYTCQPYLSRSTLSFSTVPFPLVP